MLICFFGIIGCVSLTNGHINTPIEVESQQFNRIKRAPQKINISNTENIKRTIGFVTAILDEPILKQFKEANQAYYDRLDSNRKNVWDSNIRCGRKNSKLKSAEIYFAPNDSFEGNLIIFFTLPRQ